jgi:L-lactate dehydrogenase complex protein LldG
MPAFTGWGLSKDFPRFAGRTFRERFTYKAASARPFGRAESPQHKEQDTPHPAQDVPNRVEQFTNELTMLSGHVYQTKNATKDVINFLKMRKIYKIHLEPKTLDENLLRKENIDFTYAPDPQILVGVTSAFCGLADTGSILIVDGEGDPLKASLLPEIHIAVLKSSNILPSLPDAMNLVKDTGTAIFITGPSRTADIEMTLTIGVHGPKEIHIFVDDSNSG